MRNWKVKSNLKYDEDTKYDIQYRCLAESESKLRPAWVHVTHQNKWSRINFKENRYFQNVSVKNTSQETHIYLDDDPSSIVSKIHVTNATGV